MSHAAKDRPAAGRSHHRAEGRESHLPRLRGAAVARRTVITLDGATRLRLQIRSCRDPGCRRYKACLRPEQEGRHALPQHEFGPDVIAAVGRLRHAEHRSMLESVALDLA